MNYRIDKEGLFIRLGIWNGFLKRRVHLIACGGTALTLQNIKPSTKDVDLLVPDLKEYDYLVKTLAQLGYKPVTGYGWSRDDGFVFDLFRGKLIHTTELLESPIEKNNHILVKEFSRIYLGVLNHYDLIISKLFRATTVDIDDCLALIRARTKEIDFDKLQSRFRETAKYDTSEEAVIKNLEHFLGILEKEGLINE
ncbi:MAG: DUF6036 family nucleotidyltransferase [Planctomycetota bacterium]